MKPIGDGTDGKAGGAGGTSGTPEDAAETEAHNDFLLGLGDAVAQGADAAMDFAVDFLGDDLAVNHTNVDPIPNGWCPTWDETTCGDMPTGIADYDPSSQPDDSLAALAREVVLSSLRGSDWTDCEREVLIAAWGLLARNLDLADWALCTATGDTDGGACIADILLGAKGIEIQKHPCDGLARGWPVADTAELIVGLTGTFLLTFPFWFDQTPELWLCMSDGPSTLENSSALFCDDATYNRDCGIVALASLLLHEFTHICFRDWFDTFDNCSPAYLVGNYFLWAANHRFPTVAVSPCCGGSLPVPGRDDMSADWFPCPHGLNTMNNPPLQHHVASKPGAGGLTGLVQS